MDARLLHLAGITGAEYPGPAAARPKLLPHLLGQLPVDDVDDAACVAMVVGTEAGAGRPGDQPHVVGRGGQQTLRAGRVPWLLTAPPPGRDRTLRLPQADGDLPQGAERQ